MPRITVGWQLPVATSNFVSTHVGLVLEVDGVAVALLQDAGVEVVLVLRVQLPPAADVLARHVVAAHLRKYQCQG